MKIQATKPFAKDYGALPQDIRQCADKQSALLLENPQTSFPAFEEDSGHPEIREGRITGKYRSTFQIAGDTYILRRIGEHERTLRRP